MTTDATPTPTSHERILAAATGLFALHGFDGVSTRQIAAETGLNISTIHHHVGSKRELYLKVIEGLYEKEELLIGEMLLGVDDAAIQDPERFNKALFSLIGRLLDFARENQARQRLYVRRWLDPADELREREWHTRRESRPTGCSCPAPLNEADHASRIMRFVLIIPSV